MPFAIKQYVVMFSGGIASFEAARRTILAKGVDNVTCLFADTLIEDQDLYRFIDQSIAHLGVKFVRLCEGRTPWQVFNDVRFIGNSRVDPCSKILKRDICDKWLLDNCVHDETVVVLGLDWTETHRISGAHMRYLQNGWDTEYPLNEAPWFDKNKVLAELIEHGIDLPRLYRLGFEHNNCGGFCIKAGQGHFAKLLHDLPDVYAMHEAEEQKLRDILDKDVTILRSRQGGKHKSMTLKHFRRRVEIEDYDPTDIGGCGCFST